MIQNKKINKYILAAAGAGALLLSAGFIYAQTLSLDELRARAELRAQEVREKVEQLRDQAEDRAKEARERAQQRISQIRDQKKREAAQRIADRLNHVNKVWTDHFVSVLDKLDAVLQKIKSRTQKASDNGQDVSSVNTAIQKAEAAITAARTAVMNQAQKTYNIDATQVANATSDDSSQNSLVSQLRFQFKALRELLFKDLKSLRDGAMKDARNAVHDTFQALRQVPNVDEEPDTNQ